MASPDLNELMQQLITGLEVLQNDYTLLFSQHAALEHKLANARDQYNELAKLYDQTAINTPPLSLASATFALRNEEEQPRSAADILQLRNENEAAKQLRAATDASRTLLATMKSGLDNTSGHVRIWSGPSADQSTQSIGKLPSIHESPMEQDFTIPGTPSRLGCPFASMTGRKLSSHAASVLSRYHGSQHDGKGSSREAASGNGSVVSRGPSRCSKRQSFVDPIKAEICGLDSHSQTAPKMKAQSEVEDTPEASAEPGVCPIRFLNQHSPEELATYFERHKHELPRSHEVCVRRYQSNQEQVRELDARYGDVAQMIRGLGEKHQSFLPKDPEDEALEEFEEPTSGDDTRVQKWANGVGKQPDDDQTNQHLDDEDGNSRQSHFSRPLRDVRVGESPSRPWGISVPAQYLERKGSDASSIPAQIKAPAITPADVEHQPDEPAITKPAPRCPFAAMGMGKTGSGGEQSKAAAPALPEGHPPVDIPAAKPISEASVPVSVPVSTTKHGQQNVFNGPIVVGYGPEDAALFLSKLGYQNKEV